MSKPDVVFVAHGTSHLCGILKKDDANTEATTRRLIFERKHITLAPSVQLHLVGIFVTADDRSLWFYSTEEQLEAAGQYAALHFDGRHSAFTRKMQA